uniref:AH domain-containing protein n=1 Tax=Gongylonema pulchrum TaxID=637853 RepID=A0A183ECF6_9BILA
LAMSKVFAVHFHEMNEAQKGLAESLYQLSLKENSLSVECAPNCDSLRSVAHNGELLERALSFFLSSLATLSEKTIEDTMLTIHNHDQARLEYDVHRNEAASLQQSGASPEILAAAEARCRQYKEKYEQLKADVKASFLFQAHFLQFANGAIVVKLRLLKENRLKVMRKQLLLLHNALSAYFSGGLSLKL